jgi:hypothetical protein
MADAVAGGEARVVDEGGGARVVDDRAGARLVDAGGLPELAAVWWRPRTDESSLRRTERLWLAWTVAQTAPFLAIGALLVALKPLLVPMSLLAIAWAWLIAELYAARGAAVLRPRRPPITALEKEAAERTALGLLGDLLDHRSRALHGRSALVLEPGELGTWVLGEAGAVLVRPGGRRAHCYCVRPTDSALPHGDRIAHLLLALRADEAGFATLANLAFCGARWRLRRRLDRCAREAVDAAVEASALR